MEGFCGWRFWRWRRLVTYISPVQAHRMAMVLLRAGAGGVGGGGSGAFNGNVSHHDIRTISVEWSPGGDGMCIIMFV